MDVATAVFRWSGDWCGAPVLFGFSIAKMLDKEERTKENRAVQNREVGQNLSCEASLQEKSLEKP